MGSSPMAVAHASAEDIVEPTPIAPVRSTAFLQNTLT